MPSEAVPPYTKSDTMYILFTFTMPGGFELLIIALILILLFGARKIPDLARGIGKGIREFKNASKPSDEAKKDENTKQTDKE